MLKSSNLKWYSNNDVIIFINRVSKLSKSMQMISPNKSKKLNVMIGNEMRMYQNTLITLPQWRDSKKTRNYRTIIYRHNFTWWKNISGFEKWTNYFWNTRQLTRLALASQYSTLTIFFLANIKLPMIKIQIRF